MRYPKSDAIEPAGQSEEGGTGRQLLAKTDSRFNFYKTQDTCKNKSLMVCKSCTVSSQAAMPQVTSFAHHLVSLQMFLQACNVRTSMHNLLLQDFKFALWTGNQSRRPKLEHSGRRLHYLLLRQWRHHQQCRPLPNFLHERQFQETGTTT